MPALSCCIIARNEAHRLPPLLQSLSAVSDQIVVVDTGYTDQDTVTAEQRRNLDLLKKDLIDYPRDGFLHYLAGMGWLDLKETTRAKNELLRAWELTVTDPEKGHIALGAALELVEISFREREAVHEEVVLWFERAEDMDKAYPRCLYLRGRIDYEKGE